MTIEWQYFKCSDDNSSRSAALQLSILSIELLMRVQRRTTHFIGEPIYLTQRSFHTTLFATWAAREPVQETENKNMHNNLNRIYVCTQAYTHMTTKYKQTNINYILWWLYSFHLHKTQKDYKVHLPLKVSEKHTFSFCIINWDICFKLNIS